MTHEERIRAVAIELGMPITAVRSVWDAIGAGMLLQARKNQEATIPNFMTMTVRKIGGRRYWDERTQTNRYIGLHKSISIRIVPAMKLRLKTIGF